MQSSPKKTRSDRFMNRSLSRVRVFSPRLLRLELEIYKKNFFLAYFKLIFEIGFLFILWSLRFGTCFDSLNWELSVSFRHCKVYYFARYVGRCTLAIINILTHFSQFGVQLSRAFGHKRKDNNLHLRRGLFFFSLQGSAGDQWITVYHNDAADLWNCLIDQGKIWLN